MIAVTGVMSFFIFKPFLTALALALTAAVVFFPVYKYILARVKGARSFASLATIVLIFILIITPLTLVGIQLVQEASSLYGSMLVSGNSNIFTDWLASASASLSPFFPGLENASLNLSGYTQKGLSLLLANALPIFSNMATLLLNTVVFLMALFFLLRDGELLADKLVRLSPLYDTDDKNILASLSAAIHSVVTGNLLTAIIQGVIATVGFVIFGIPHAILFGSIASIAALLPGVGTALVIIPAVLYLLATGSVVATAGLAVWGAVAVGTIDNFLGPKLMARGMTMPSIVVFLSVVGGIGLFGPFGFIFGPLIVSLFLTLTEFFFKKKLA